MFNHLRKSLPPVFQQLSSSSSINLNKINFKMSSDFANIRAKYNDPSKAFDLPDLASKDPIKQFDDWFQLARKTDGIKEPNAMSISTATLEGKPSSRMVLLKDFSDKGFTFFTNYTSKKGKELEKNPQCSLLFYWDIMSRQIRMDGRAVKIDRDTSIEYFSKRPLKSRVSALISDQSKVIPNRKVLVDAQQEATKKYEGDGIVPCPENWGGYLFVPDVFEFWQGNDIRLHDRLVFSRKTVTDDKTQTEGENGWVIERLAP